MHISIVSCFLVLLSLAGLQTRLSYRLTFNPAPRRLSYETRAHPSAITSQQIQAIFDECGVVRTERLERVFRELYRGHTLELDEELVQKQRRMDEMIERSRLMERPADVTRREIDEVTAKWKKHDDDTGSSEYQIAMLTVRIKHLTTHFIKNKQDKHGKRGMTALVHQRRKLMNYLYKHDKQKALDMAKELDFTFRPNDRPWDPKLKYVQYPKITYERVKKKGKKGRKKVTMKLIRVKTIGNKKV